MNKSIQFAKCSNILKDPFKTKYSKPMFYFWYNKMRTYLNIKNFENYFVDFQPYLFPEQAKQIFDEVGHGIKEGNLNIISKNLNENLIIDPKGDNKYLNDIFNKKTYGWEIVHARTLYLTEFMEELSNNYAQITLSYFTEQLEKNYIVFEREITLNYSMYHWKIFIPKYEYFGKTNFY